MIHEDPERTAPDLEELTGALVPVEAINPVALFGEGEGIDALLAEVRRQTQDIVPDVTSEKGRKQVKSLAYRVSRTKTALEEVGKKFTEDRRAELKKIDANRSRLAKELDAIRDATRRPVDEWEAAEEARQQAELEAARREAEAREAAERFALEVDGRIQSLRGIPVRFIEMEITEAERTLSDLEATVITTADYGERAAEAEAALAMALTQARQLIGMKRTMAEAEERQRQAEEAERQRQAEEAERRRKQELEAQRQAEAEAERKRQEELAAHQAEAERAARVARAARSIAAIRSATAASMSTQEIGEKLARAMGCELDPDFYGELLPEAQAALQETIEALRAMHAQASELEERRRQEAEAERQRKEDERQAANKAHRKRISTEVAEDLASIAGFAEAVGDTATRAALATTLASAIAAGQVRHTSIKF